MRANISLTISTMKVITLKIQYPDENVCNILGIMPLIIHFYWFRLIRSDSGLCLHNKVVYQHASEYQLNLVYENKYVNNSWSNYLTYIV